MKITREKDYLGFYELKIAKENKILTISFGGNGDLYWTLIKKKKLSVIANFYKKEIRNTMKNY